MQICGIYKITNLVNQKVYIGKSKNIRERWNAHIRDSNVSEDKWVANIRGVNTPLHRAIRKYGTNNFAFEIIEECPEPALNDREKYWIKYYNTFRTENGYNCTLGGDGYVCGGDENAPSSKLTQKQVDFIKEKLKDKWSAKQIQEYIPQASLYTISNINCGRQWIDEQEEYPLSRYGNKRKFSDEEVICIRKEYQQGKTQKELSAKYGVSLTALAYIVQGVSYSELPLFPRNPNFKQIRRKESKFTEKQVQFYRKKYQQGMSIFSLWKQYEQENCCYATFYKMIKGISYNKAGDKL